METAKFSPLPPHEIEGDLIVRSRFRGILSSSPEMVLQGPREGGEIDNGSQPCLCDRPVAHVHHNQMQTLESFGGAQMFLQATRARNRLIITKKL